MGLMQNEKFKYAYTRLSNLALGYILLKCILNR